MRGLFSLIVAPVFDYVGRSTVAFHTIVVGAENIASIEDSN